MSATTENVRIIFILEVIAINQDNTLELFILNAGVKRLLNVAKQHLNAPFNHSDSAKAETLHFRNGGRGVR
jgi:hypothetical protein